MSAFAGVLSRAAMACMRSLRFCREARARDSFLLYVCVTRWRRAASASLRLGVGPGLRPEGSRTSGAGVVGVVAVDPLLVPRRKIATDCLSLVPASLAGGEDRTAAGRPDP